jgi:hypothetical protein
MKWALVLVLAFAPSAASAEVEGRLERLVDWQEDPLDLVEADAPDLAMLPGMDADLAEAVVGLREAGRLGAVDDLAQVPGIGVAGVEALRPYVRVGSPAGPRGLDWSTEAQRRESAATVVRHRFAFLASGVSAVGVVPDGSPRAARAAVRVGRDDVALRVGHLRAASAGGLFDFRPGRSRVAAASRPRAAAVNARTDSSADAGWVGVALSRPGALLLAGRAPDGEPAGGAAFDLGFGDTRTQLATRIERGAWAASADVVHGGSAWLGITAEPGVRSARAGLRLRGTGWRAGVDASTTDGGLRAGSDPVTGHRLDRRHHVLQLHGRLRATGFDLAGLWRELARGDAAATSTVEFETTWRATGSPVFDRLVARVRVSPQRRLTLEAAHRSGASSWRLRFTREVGEVSRSELIGAEWKVRRGRHELRLTVVGVDGSASRSWMFSRPHTGIQPVWLRPPGLLGGAAWGLGGAALRIGAWAWLRADAGRRPAPGFGIFCAIRAGELVRRLQGPVGTKAARAVVQAPSRRQTR